MISTVVWGTGNVGRAAIRAVDAHPALKLTAVLVHNPAKVGRDAGELAGLGRELGVAATDDIDAVLAAGPRAVVYAASGDIRARRGARRHRCARSGPAPSSSRPPSTRSTTSAAPRPSCGTRCWPRSRTGGGSLFVSGVDPGWGNDVLPLLISGLGTTVDVIRCQEIFDYSTYDQHDSVRYLVGMGQPMDYEPPMLAPTVPTMVWGGQIRLMARALGVELDEIRETLERRPLEADGEHQDDGRVRGGHPGRGPVRGAGHRRRRAAHRHRARHPHPPVLRAGLAARRRTASARTA